MHVDKGEERATDGTPGLPTGRGAEHRPAKWGKSDLEPKGGRWGRAVRGAGAGRGDCDGLGGPIPGAWSARRVHSPRRLAEASSPDSEVLRPQRLAVNVSPLPRSPPQICTFL